LRNLLELTGAVSIIGEAEDGWDAIRQVKALTPDIVLMDLEMPGLDGFEATRQIKDMHLARAVIIISVYADVASQQKAREAGADAFFVKGTDLHTLLELFDQFSEGQAEIPNPPHEL
jgi:DNA-binding NarL/FixJ family response regulator